MDKFTTLTGVAAPMPLVNIDTDMIIPKQFLKTIARTGLGKNLFDEMRYTLDGAEIPGFVLNQPAYRHAELLIAGDNFGCGSSREHAPWALTQFGFKAVISTSFADIFKANSLKNSLLPIVVSRDVHAKLFKMRGADAAMKLTIDLQSQRLTLPDGESVEFPVDSFSKACLVDGVDEIGYILKQLPAIEAFEAKRVGGLNTLAG